MIDVKNTLKSIFIISTIVAILLSCGCVDSTTTTTGGIATSNDVSTNTENMELTDKELSELKWQAAVKDFTDRVESGEIPYSNNYDEYFIWILAIPTDIDSYSDSFVAYYDVDVQVWKVTELQNYPYGAYKTTSNHRDKYTATFKYVDGGEEHTGYKLYYVDAYFIDPTY